MAPTLILECICRGEVLEPYVLESESEVTVGRGEESDLVLPDPHLSRRHLVLRLHADGHLWAWDLGSKNRSKLNGREFQKAQLHAGDVLIAGQSRIIARVPGTAVGAERAGVTTLEAVGQESPSSRCRHEIDARDSSRFASASSAATLGRAQLEGIYRLAESIVGVTSRESVWQAIEDALGHSVAFDRGFIGVGDPQEDSFDVVRALSVLGDDGGVLMSQTILDRIRRQRTAVLMEDVVRDLQPEGDSVRSLGISTFMCSPMLAGGEFLGVLYLDRLNTEAGFEDSDLEYLQGVAHLAGLALSGLALRERVERENARLRHLIIRKRKFVAQSEPMLEVVERAQRYARNDSPVLILGETGTGKEHVARMLHDESERCEGPFVAFNCALSSAAMIESDLFGHVRGAFTGADSSRKGRFQLAQGGTLFLDEIGDMPVDLQAKLLRVLQERQIWPVGSEKALDTDVRLITATHRNLKKLRAAGDFRDDLYYRIAALTIDVPRLSVRGEDVLRIAESFLPEPLKLAEDAEVALLAYSWPGNIRELGNAIEHAVHSRSGDKIRRRDLPREVAREGRQQPLVVKVKSLRDMEAAHIRHALEAVGGNKRRAAELLGISRNTLYLKLNQYGL